MKAINDYLSLNEWQISEIQNAIKAADDPNAKWTNQEDMEKDFNIVYKSIPGNRAVKYSGKLNILSL